MKLNEKSHVHVFTGRVVMDNHVESASLCGATIEFKLDISARNYEPWTSFYQGVLISVVS